MPGEVEAPARDVAEEYLATMERRLNIGEVSLHRYENLKSRLNGVLNQYIGSKQVHLITQDEWKEYPSWRRETGKGRIRARISDSTIGAEMTVFNAVMNFAIQKRYLPNGKPAKFLYCDTVEDLLNEAGLRIGPGEIPRTTYCFRHTYATMRLSEGVDVYILAEQMGTSVKMIEQHYGHVNTIKHADRVLMGMTGWELVREPGDDREAAAKSAKAAASRDRAGRSAVSKTRTSRRS